MKKTIYQILFTFLFCPCIAFNAQSQIEISEDIDIAKIASGTTYVIMKDPKSESVKEYVDVFKKYWTISKVDFISYQGIDSLLSPESSFISISSSSFTDRPSTDARFSGNFTYIYLELWTCDDNFLKKKSKGKNPKFNESNKNILVKNYLCADYTIHQNPDTIKKINFDGNKHILNWGPGFLKNYIQSLTSYLNKKENRPIWKFFSNPTDLKILKKEVLYIPEYLLMDKYLYIKNTKKREEKELFEDYKYKYILISDSALNEKILNEKSTFYYLMFVQCDSYKYISIINSLTGEFIYSYYSGLFNYIKSKDFKDIYEEIQSL